MQSSSVTDQYCTATNDSLYSHSTWITNTVCSLFRYFAIILFAAYTVNRREISVHFSWKFLSFSHVVSIETLFISFLSKLYFCKKNSKEKFTRWRHRSLCCFSKVVSHQILPPINSSDKFPRWRHHSVYCLFSLWAHFCAFFGSKFPSFFNIVWLAFYCLNSSHRFARWSHLYICCLYSFFGRISVRFIAF